jgi:hypothetical protein
MAAKILGKLMQFKFDGAIKHIESENFDESFNVIDMTDTETSGDGKETAVGRATRTLQVSMFLRNGSNVKVIPTTMQLTHNSIVYPLTDMSYSVSHDEIDVTDGATTGDGVEILPSFATRESSFDLWMKDTVAEPVTKTAYAATAQLISGVTIAGSLRLESSKNQGSVKDAIKVSTNGTWQGAVTDSSLNLLPVAVSKAIIMIYKDGTTDKALSGTGMITALNFNANINSGILVTYTIKFSGAVTPSLYVA